MPTRPRPKYPVKYLAFDSRLDARTLSRQKFFQVFGRNPDARQTTQIYFDISENPDTRQAALVIPQSPFNLALFTQAQRDAMVDEMQAETLRVKAVRPRRTDESGGGGGGGGGGGIGGRVLRWATSFFRK